MSIMPRASTGDAGEVSSYLELVNWLLRSCVDEDALATQVEKFNQVFQREGEDELSFAERIRALSNLCGFIHPQGVVKSRFVKGLSWAVRTKAQVLNLGTQAKTFKAGTKLGFVDPHEGVTIAVAQAVWEGIGVKPDLAKPLASEEVPRPMIHTENVPAELRPDVDALVERYHKLWSGHLGLMKAIEHRIVLQPGAKPVRQQPYRAGQRSREVVKDQVSKTSKLDVVEPSKAECASPVVIVPKPDGSSRFCIDYRRLNERTVKDSYPLPRMDDCLDSLGEAGIFSTLDCNAGYWQIPVAPEDREKTTFTSHCGTFQCKRMPFGLCNAPATFQRAMDIILAG
eukprot:contig_1820_g291